MDKHKFEVIWNKGAVERCRVRDEERTFTGTDKEFLEFLDDNYVEVMYDDDDNIVDLDTFIKEYEDYADISGSTWLKKITKDGKVIFETEYEDDEDDLDESLTLEEATVNALTKGNKDLEKENEREEAIKKLMDYSGLSREEVIEIANQIK